MSLIMFPPDFRRKAYSLVGSTLLLFTASLEVAFAATPYDGVIQLDKASLKAYIDTQRQANKQQGKAVEQYQRLEQHWNDVADAPNEAAKKAAVKSLKEAITAWQSELGEADSHWLKSRNAAWAMLDKAKAVPPGPSTIAEIPEASREQMAAILDRANANASADDQRSRAIRAWASNIMAEWDETARKYRNTLRGNLHSKADIHARIRAIDEHRLVIGTLKYVADRMLETTDGIVVIEVIQGVSITDPMSGLRNFNGLAKAAKGALNKIQNDASSDVTRYRPEEINPFRVGG